MPNDEGKIIDEKKVIRDRLFEIQTDLKHTKMRIDQIYGLLYKIERDGLKVRK